MGAHVGERAVKADSFGGCSARWCYRGGMAGCALISEHKPLVLC